MFVYESPNMTNPRYIINFPIERHWRGKSRMENGDEAAGPWKGASVVGGP
jgi:hypothetical protein